MYFSHLAWCPANKEGFLPEQKQNKDACAIFWNVSLWWILIPLVVCECSLNLLHKLRKRPADWFPLCDYLWLSSVWNPGTCPQHCFLGHGENGGKSHLSCWDGEVVDKVLCTCPSQVSDWSLPDFECAVHRGIWEDICSGIYVLIFALEEKNFCLGDIIKNTDWGCNIW